MTRQVRILLVALLLLAPGCTSSDAEKPRLSLFVGVDVSGSFSKTPHFKDALRFLSHYIYGHLHGMGGLEKPRAVFVGSIGGDVPNEPKAFHPIQVFERKNVPEIEAKLKELFDTKGNYLTDFNAFFDRVATLVKRQGLVLAPLNVVLLTDGIQDLTANSDTESRFATIDLGPLEYLSRSVTVRLLYATPTVSVAWEREIDRRRVRMWTVDHEVMRGWREQLESDIYGGGAQDNLWKWITSEN